MIIAIIGFFLNLCEKEIDYEFEMGFSIYDVIALLLVFAFVLFKLLY